MCVAASAATKALKKEDERDLLAVIKNENDVLVCTPVMTCPTINRQKQLEG